MAAVMTGVVVVMNHRIKEKMIGVGSGCHGCVKMQSKSRAETSKLDK